MKTEIRTPKILTFRFGAENSPKKPQKNVQIFDLNSIALRVSTKFERVFDDRIAALKSRFDALKSEKQISQNFQFVEKCDFASKIEKANSEISAIELRIGEAFAAESLTKIAFAARAQIAVSAREFAAQRNAAEIALLDETTRKTKARFANLYAETVFKSEEINAIETLSDFAQRFLGFEIAIAEFETRIRFAEKAFEEICENDLKTEIENLEILLENNENILQNLKIENLPFFTKKAFHFLNL